MKLTLAAIVVALAVVPSASASSKLAQQVRTAASRAGFSGEVAVARHGRIVFARSFGLANRARGRRVTLDTAFNLASLGKMVTGVAAAQLVQAGKLRFGDRIGKYLPQLPFASAVDHARATARPHLRSRDYFGDPGYERLRPTLTKLGAYLPLVTAEILQFKPGTRWSYSNSGFSPCRARDREGERSAL
jgi:D-alanyl-D-alanine carboxypeptidase